MCFSCTIMTWPLKSVNLYGLACEDFSFFSLTGQCELDGLWNVSEVYVDLRDSATLRPLCGEAAQVCRVSYGSDPYSPQTSSCTGTKEERPIMQLNTTLCKSNALGAISPMLKLLIWSKNNPKWKRWVGTKKQDDVIDSTSTIVECTTKYPIIIKKFFILKYICICTK